MKLIRIFFSILLSSLPAVSECRRLPQSCSSSCRPRGMWQYQTGSTYRYTYEGRAFTVLHSGGGENNGRDPLTDDSPTVDEDSGVLLAFSATADIHVESQCEHILQLHEVHFDTTDQPETAGRMAELAEILQEYPLRYSFQDGTVESICPDANEDNWAANVKRGIVSALQVSSLGQQPKVVEEDVLGNCETNYETKKRTPEEIHLIKKRHGSNCGHNTNLLSSLSTARLPLYSEQESFMKSRYTCDHVIRSGVLQRTTCDGIQTVTMFREHGSLASTKMLQILQFQSLLNLPALYTGEFSRGSLLYDFTSSNTDRVNNWREILQELCDHRTADSEQLRNIERLHIELKNMDAERLYYIYRTTQSETSTINILNDIIPLLGTEASVELIKSQLQLNELPEDVQKYWISSLSYLQKPTTDIIAAASEILRISPGENAILPVSTLVGRFCQINPHCADEQPVDDIVTTLIDTLRDDCTCETEEEERMALITLRAIGNIGVSTAEVSMFLTTCSTNFPVPLSVRLAALRAHGSFACESQDESVFNLFYDHDQDVEIRIESARGLLRCSDADSLTRLASKLLTEPSRQVGSYLWSWLSKEAHNDIMDMPGGIKQILADENLRAKFETDAMKFSKNYKGSYTLDMFGGTTANYDTSVIFSPDSIAPRQVDIDLKIDVFGQRFDLFEASTRLQGLESYMKKLFGDDSLPANEGFDVGRPLGRTFDIPPPDKPKSISSFLKLGSEQMYWDLKSIDNNKRDLTQFLNTFLRDEVFQQDYMTSLVDSSFVFATMLGLPQSVRIRADALMALSIEGNFDLRAMALSPSNIDISAKLGTSAFIRASAEFSLAMNDITSGHKVQGHMNTELTAAAGLKVDGGQQVQLYFDVPKDTIWKAEAKIERIKMAFGSETAIPSDEHSLVEQCTDESVSTVTGIKACYSMSPSIPLEFSMRIMKADTHSRYSFYAGMEQIKDISNNRLILRDELRVSFNTPLSSVDRELLFQLTLDRINYGFEALLKTPWKTMEGSARIRNANGHKDASFQVLVDYETIIMIIAQYGKNSGLEATNYFLMVQSECPWTPDLNIFWSATTAEDSVQSNFTVALLRQGGLEQVEDRYLFRFQSSNQFVMRQNVFRLQGLAIYTWGSHDHHVETGLKLRRRRSDTQPTYTLDWQLTSSQFPWLDSQLQVSTELSWTSLKTDASLHLRGLEENIQLLVDAGIDGDINRFNLAGKQRFMWRSRGINLGNELNYDHNLAGKSLSLHGHLWNAPDYNLFVGLNVEKELEDRYAANMHANYTDASDITKRFQSGARYVLSDGHHEIDISIPTFDIDTSVDFQLQWTDIVGRISIQHPQSQQLVDTTFKLQLTADDDFNSSFIFMYPMEQVSIKTLLTYSEMTKLLYVDIQRVSNGFTLECRREIGQTVENTFRLIYPGRNIFLRHIDVGTISSLKHYVHFQWEENKFISATITGPFQFENRDISLDTIVTIESSFLDNIVLKLRADSNNQRFEYLLEGTCGYYMLRSHLNSTDLKNITTWLSITSSGALFQNVNIYWMHMFAPSISEVALNCDFSGPKDTYHISSSVLHNEYSLIVMYDFDTPIVQSSAKWQYKHDNSYYTILFDAKSNDHEIHNLANFTFEPEYLVWTMTNQLVIDSDYVEIDITFDSKMERNMKHVRVRTASSIEVISLLEGHFSYLINESTLYLQTIVSQQGEKVTDVLIESLNDDTLFRLCWFNKLFQEFSAYVESNFFDMSMFFLNASLNIENKKIIYIVSDMRNDTKRMAIMALNGEYFGKVSTSYLSEKSFVTELNVGLETPFHVFRTGRLRYNVDPNISDLSLSCYYKGNSGEDEMEHKYLLLHAFSELDTLYLNSSYYSTSGDDFDELNVGACAVCISGRINTSWKTRDNSKGGGEEFQIVFLANGHTMEPYNGSLSVSRIQPFGVLAFDGQIKRGSSPVLKIKLNVIGSGAQQTLRVISFADIQPYMSVDVQTDLLLSDRSLNTEIILRQIQIWNKDYSGDIRLNYDSWNRECVIDFALTESQIPRANGHIELRSKHSTSCDVNIWTAYRAIERVRLQAEMIGTVSDFSATLDAQLNSVDARNFVKVLAASGLDVGQRQFALHGEITSDVEFFNNGTLMIDISQNGFRTKASMGYTSPSHEIIYDIELFLRGIEHFTIYLKMTHPVLVNVQLVYNSELEGFLSSFLFNINNVYYVAYSGSLQLVKPINGVFSINNSLIPLNEARLTFVIQQDLDFDSEFVVEMYNTEIANIKCMFKLVEGLETRIYIKTHITETFDFNIRHFGGLNYRHNSSVCYGIKCIIVESEMQILPFQFQFGLLTPFAQLKTMDIEALFEPKQAGFDGEFTVICNNESSLLITTYFAKTREAIGRYNFALYSPNIIRFSSSFEHTLAWPESNIKFFFDNFGDQVSLEGGFDTMPLTAYFKLGTPHSLLQTVELFSSISGTLKNCRCVLQSTMNSNSVESNISWEFGNRYWLEYTLAVDSSVIPTNIDLNTSFTLSWTGSGYAFVAKAKLNNQEVETSVDIFMFTAGFRFSIATPFDAARNLVVYIRSERNQFNTQDYNIIGEVSFDGNCPICQWHSTADLGLTSIVLDILGDMLQYADARGGVIHPVPIAIHAELNRSLEWVYTGSNDAADRNTLHMLGYLVIESNPLINFQSHANFDRHANGHFHLKTEFIDQGKSFYRYIRFLRAFDANGVVLMNSAPFISGKISFNHQLNRLGIHIEGTQDNPFMMNFRHEGLFSFNNTFNFTKANELVLMSNVSFQTSPVLWRGYVITKYPTIQIVNSTFMLSKSSQEIASQALLTVNNATLLFDVFSTGIIVKSKLALPETHWTQSFRIVFEHVGLLIDFENTLTMYVGNTAYKMTNVLQLQPLKLHTVIQTPFRRYEEIGIRLVQTGNLQREYEGVLALTYQTDKTISVDVNVRVQRAFLGYVAIHGLGHQVKCKLRHVFVNDKLRDILVLSLDDKDIDGELVVHLQSRPKGWLKITTPFNGFSHIDGEFQYDTNRNTFKTYGAITIDGRKVSTDINVVYYTLKNTTGKLMVETPIEGAERIGILVSNMGSDFLFNSDIEIYIPGDIILNGTLTRLSDSNDIDVHASLTRRGSEKAGIKIDHQGLLWNTQTEVVLRSEYMENINFMVTCAHVLSSDPYWIRLKLNAEPIGISDLHINTAINSQHFYPVLMQARLNRMNNIETSISINDDVKFNLIMECPTLLIEACSIEMLVATEQVTVDIDVNIGITYAVQPLVLLYKLNYSKQEHSVANMLLFTSPFPLCKELYINYDRNVTGENDNRMFIIGHNYYYINGTLHYGKGITHHSAFIYHNESDTTDVDGSFGYRMLIRDEDCRGSLCQPASSYGIQFIFPQQTWNISVTSDSLMQQVSLQLHYLRDVSKMLTITKINAEYDSRHELQLRLHSPLMSNDIVWATQYKINTDTVLCLCHSTLRYSNDPRKHAVFHFAVQKPPSDKLLEFEIQHVETGIFYSVELLQEETADSLGRKGILTYQTTTGEMRTISYSSDFMSNTFEQTVSFGNLTWKTTYSRQEGQFRSFIASTASNLTIINISSKDSRTELSQRSNILPCTSNVLYSGKGIWGIEMNKDCSNTEPASRVIFNTSKSGWLQVNVRYGMMSGSAMQIASDLLAQLGYVGDMIYDEAQLLMEDARQKCHQIIATTENTEIVAALNNDLWLLLRQGVKVKRFLVKMYNQDIFLVRTLKHILATAAETANHYIGRVIDVIVDNISPIATAVLEVVERGYRWCESQLHLVVQQVVSICREHLQCALQQVTANLEMAQSRLDTVLRNVVQGFYNGTMAYIGRLQNMLQEWVDIVETCQGNNLRIMKNSLSIIKESWFIQKAIEALYDEDINQLLIIFTDILQSAEFKHTVIKAMNTIENLGNIGHSMLLDVYDIIREAYDRKSIANIPEHHITNIQQKILNAEEILKDFMKNQSIFHNVTKQCPNDTCTFLNGMLSVSIRSSQEEGATNPSELNINLPYFPKVFSNNAWKTTKRTTHLLKRLFEPYFNRKKSSSNWSDLLDTTGTAIILNNTVYTFDDQIVDLNGQCPVVLAHDLVNNSFTVTFHPVTQQLTIFYKTNTLELFVNGSCRFNSEEITLPFVDNDLAVHGKNEDVLIRLGERLAVSLMSGQRMYTIITLRGWRAWHSTAGVLGVLSGEAKDDYILPSGYIAMDKQGFVKDWTFTNGCITPSSIDQSGDVVAHQEPPNQQSCDAVFGSVRSPWFPCFSHVLNEMFKEHCAVDYCGTVQAYHSKCHASTVILPETILCS